VLNLDDEGLHDRTLTNLLFRAGGLQANSRTMSRGSADSIVARTAVRAAHHWPAAPARLSTQSIRGLVRRQHYRYFRGAPRSRRLEGVLPRHALLMKIHKPPKASFNEIRIILV
jgi:hypothetical protein